jgi:hypothetical protein
MIDKNPDMLFLIIGKHTTSVVQEEGENTVRVWSKKIEILGLQHHVKFINTFTARGIT